MRSAMCCRKGMSLLAALLLGGAAALPAQAVTLNFSANLTTGTCTFNLDKSALNLGVFSPRELQPATLAGAQPFTLAVTACSGTALNLTPVVNITGDGVTQDGRWLFRAADSAVSGGVGVMLVKSSVPPTYSATEVKNNEDIALAAKGVNPADQSLTFYAGMTCGSSGCANLPVGTLTARVLFQLAYR